MRLARAARIALRRWYYRPEMPVGRQMVFSVFEAGRFIGVLIYGYSASSTLGRRYQMPHTECVDLLRIALDKHAARR